MGRAETGLKLIDQRIEDANRDEETVRALELAKLTIIRRMRLSALGDILVRKLARSDRGEDVDEAWSTLTLCYAPDAKSSSATDAPHDAVLLHSWWRSQQIHWIHETSYPEPGKRNHYVITTTETMQPVRGLEESLSRLLSTAGSLDDYDDFIRMSLESTVKRLDVSPSMPSTPGGAPERPSCPIATRGKPQGAAKPGQPLPSLRIGRADILTAPTKPCDCGCARMRSGSSGSRGASPTRPGACSRQVQFTKTQYVGGPVRVMEGR